MKEEKYLKKITNSQNEIQRAIDILDFYYNEKKEYFISRDYHTYATNKITTILSMFDCLKNGYIEELKK